MELCWFVSFFPAMVLSDLILLFFYFSLGKDLGSIYLQVFFVSFHQLDIVRQHIRELLTLVNVAGSVVFLIYFVWPSQSLCFVFCLN